MGSIEPAIVFVVSVTLEKVSKIIQIHSIHAENGHLVDRMRIFSAAAYRIGRTGVDRCEDFQRFVTRFDQRLAVICAKGGGGTILHGEILIRTTK